MSDEAIRSREHGVEIETFPWFGQQFSPAFARSIASRCAEADLIHDHGLWRHVNWATAAAARRSNKPYVITPLGLLAPAALAHARLKKMISAMLFEKRLLRNAALIHAASEIEYESARAYGVTKPIAIIPNGIEPASLDNGAPESSLEERYPELRGKRILLFLSRISWEKGVTELVEAWNKLCGQFPGWHLVIVGEGNLAYERNVKCLIKGSQLCEHVTWMGPLYGAAKQEVLSHASLFVLPTHCESFGIVILEALAAGVPVVTTRKAPWEVLLSEKCGWWIPRGHGPLVETLREAMSCPVALLQEMGQRGRALARSRFSWEQSARQMETVYKWLLKDGDMPDCVRLL